MREAAVGPASFRTCPEEPKCAAAPCSSMDGGGTASRRAHGVRENALKERSLDQGADCCAGLLGSFRRVGNLGVLRRAHIPFPPWVCHGAASRCPVHVSLFE